MWKGQKAVRIHSQAVSSLWETNYSVVVQISRLAIVGLLLLCLGSSPYYNLLESVQVFACKIATQSWSESHINLRSECNLPPLAVRRAYFKYSCCFSYHKLAYYPHNFLQPRPSSSIRACGAHSFQLICPFARTNSCMYSFVHASIRLWNKLPTSIAQVTAYPLFKKLIRKHLCMC